MDGERFALVTGGGSGIGRASALALARAGWHVALAGRRREPLESRARDRALGRRAVAAPATSATRRRSRRCSRRSKRASAGSISCSTTPARARPPFRIDELTYAQWKAVVDVNLNGAFLCAQGAFGLMKRQRPQGGRIINNGSISAHAPRPFSAPYTATKHAITGFTKSIALDGRATISPAARSTSATR